MCEQNWKIYSAKMRRFHIGTKGVLFDDHQKTYSQLSELSLLWHYKDFFCVPTGFIEFETTTAMAGCLAIGWRSH